MLSRIYFIGKLIPASALITESRLPEGWGADPCENVGNSLYYRDDQMFPQGRMERAD